MKGMQKIKRGTGFRGVLEYALENDRGEIVGGNMTGITPRELAREFGQSRALREDIEKPVWHNSLRLPKGEKLDPEKWATIADDYMKKMGFGELHQRAYILHNDDDGQHIHIIASRIDMTGKLYLGQNENLKSTKYIGELEREHGLTQTAQQRDPNTPHRKAITEGEKGLEIRTGEVPARKQLQTIIDKAAADKPQFNEFVKRLNVAEVSVLPSGKTGTPQGVSFEHGGQAFKGSDLGKAYAWKQLQARIDYHPARDQSIIDQLRTDNSPAGMDKWRDEHAASSPKAPKKDAAFYADALETIKAEIKDLPEDRQKKILELAKQRIEKEMLVNVIPGKDQLTPPPPTPSKEPEPPAPAKEEDRDIDM
jgi:hypothetical protein